MLNDGYPHDMNSLSDKHISSLNNFGGDSLIKQYILLACLWAKLFLNILNSDICYKPRVPNILQNTALYIGSKPQFIKL